MVDSCPILFKMDNVSNGAKVGHTGLWSIGGGDASVPNIENSKIELKLLCLMVNNTHDSCETVSTIFQQKLRDLLMKI